MILFLDFDGVTHPELRGEPDFCRNPLLWQILRACPNVDVVFSTSWREIYTFDELIGFVTINGGEDLAHCFIAANPSILREQGAYNNGKQYRRESECRLWMQINEPQRSWLAVDDLAVFFSPFSPVLHLTDRKTGLTDADVAAIIRRIHLV